jgi:hypothetical protein
VLLALPGSAAAASAPTTPAPPAPPTTVSITDPVNQWLPDSDGATWTYRWSDGTYSPTPTTERYTFSQRVATAFRVAWTTDGLGNPSGSVQEAGTMDFNRTDAGLIATSWSSAPPPPQFPVLCAEPGGCPNTLAGSFFMLIWGTRTPTLAEPALLATRWSALGGGNNDVSSDNRYLGTERVIVPAFPQGVVATKVQSDITQAGALGDPWGSGTRTVWWVYGVGPVQITIGHVGGDEQISQLVGTNLKPLAPPPNANYLPLNVGQKMRFRWRNSRYMPSWSKQELDVSQVVNNTARVDVKSLSGPIRAAGSYIFSTRLTGVTNVSGFTKAATKLKFPGLGPLSLPAAQRRHFFTPFDLMVYGFNPVLPAYPAVRQAWRSSRVGRDFAVFGVDGSSQISGLTRVRTPAGSFDALTVKSLVTQQGSRFGSGGRTSYFAPGVGLVKLVFRHRDGSVSTVERLP